MKVNEIIGRLEKAGFKQARAFKIANIATEGGWLTGTYLGSMEFKTDDGTKLNHKFRVTDGEAILNQGDKSIGKIEKDSEVVIFGSGLLNYLLKEREGKVVAVVYKGMESYKKGKKTIKAHQYEVLDTK